MKRRNLLLIFTFILFYQETHAQKNGYTDSLKHFQQAYADSHEIVKPADKKYFRFYPVNKSYRVLARFEKIADSAGFIMKTSGSKLPTYFRYGNVYFHIGKKDLKLTVYQSRDLMNNPQYKDYLFIPFTDLTSGETSYAGGRYLDLLMNDINNNSLVIDFNKAYNPYCAYATGFNCPIPPRENNLSIAIKAGEMNFDKTH
jgi:uncharacterized protein (DUF1684 family)